MINEMIDLMNKLNDNFGKMKGQLTRNQTSRARIVQLSSLFSKSNFALRYQEQGQGRHGSGGGRRRRWRGKVCEGPPMKRFEFVCIVYSARLSLTLRTQYILQADSFVLHFINFVSYQLYIFQDLELECIFNLSYMHRDQRAEEPYRKKVRKRRQRRAPRRPQKETRRKRR